MSRTVHAFKNGFSIKTNILSRAVVGTGDGKLAPAPNNYYLPTTVGYQKHDPSRWKDPAYTMRVKHKEEPVGLGPGMYNISNKTRFSQCGRKDTGITMGVKLPDCCDYSSPGPVYYKHEKCNLKQNAPKFTMGSRTKILSAQYVPSSNTYTLPTTIGPRIPDKPCNGAFTMRLKTKTPRGSGFPGPDRYGPVKLNVYKPASAKFTMASNKWIPTDKTQKPAPNQYKPKFKNKESGQQASFGRRDVDSRVIYLTLDDIKP